MSLKTTENASLTYTTKTAITTEHSSKNKTAGTHSANVKLHIVK